MSMARALRALGLALAVDALRMDIESDEARGACKCLKFADVYEKKLAECGMGLEQGSLAKEPPAFMADAKQFMEECTKKTWGARTIGEYWRAINEEGFCSWKTLSKMDPENCNDFPGIPNSSFYRNQRHSYCLKASNFEGPGSFLNDANWCYVSSKCQRLNGGERINDAVSWKSCQKGQDKFLADLDVPKLCELQEKLHPAGKDLGICQMAAFKAYPANGGKRPAPGVDPDLPEWAVGMPPGAVKALKSKQGKRPATHWKDSEKDAAVVQKDGRVYEIYGSLKDGSEFKCVTGC